MPILGIRSNRGMTIIKEKFIGSLLRGDQGVRVISLLLLISNLVVWVGFSFYNFLGNPIDERILISAVMLSGVLAVGAFLRKGRSLWFTVLFYCAVMYCVPFLVMYGLVLNQDIILWHLMFVGGVMGVLLVMRVECVGPLFLLGGFLGYVACNLLEGEMFLGEQFFMTAYGGGGLLVFAGLVSYRKHLDEEERLENMSLLAGAMAHEMRTPLASIRLFCEGGERVLGRRGFSESDQLVGVLRKIDEASSEALGTIERLLVQSKGFIKEDECGVWSMSESVRRVLEEFPFVGEEARLVETVLEKDFYFRGGEGEVKLVINNLIKNGLEQIREEGRGGLTIEVGQGGKSVLRVCDTGGGIREEAMPYIFDVYYTTKSYGTGLGLGFCKHVMERLGGSISCYSVFGEGAEFTLYFPRVRNIERTIK